MPGQTASDLTLICQFFFFFVPPGMVVAHPDVRAVPEPERYDNSTLEVALGTFMKRKRKAAF